MKTIMSLLIFFLVAIARAADPSADIAVSFAPRQGEPVTVIAPSVLLNEGVTLPLDIPNAVRIVEVAPRFDEKGSTIKALVISILDPGTILPATPGVPSASGAPAASPIPPHPVVLLKTTVPYAADREISFFKTAQGEWSIKVSKIAKP
jgi:hypothetical protein